MKKKSRSIFICLFAVLIFGAASGLLYLHLLPSPLEDYDFTNCTVGVFGYWSDEIICDLTQAETDAFIQVLEAAKISPIAEKSDFAMSGQTRLFRIRLSDGNMVELGAGGGHYIYLNGKWYKCGKAAVSYFSNLFLEYARQYFVPFSESA